MGKKYKSVSDVVKNLSDDKGFHEDFKNQAFDKMLSKTLFAMRCSKGVTQAEMAEKMDCTQSRVSKLEHSGLDTIKVSDLVSYAGALDLKMSIAFHEDMTSVESVKFHAFEIKKHLDHLADLAHRDDGIFEGVKEFNHSLIVSNFLKRRKSLTREQEYCTSTFLKSNDGGVTYGYLYNSCFKQTKRRSGSAKEAVPLAGSRNLHLPETMCTDLLHAFSEHGFSFFVGDATGVDRCFREAIAGTSLQEKTLVACAFTRRREYSFSKRLLATKVVPDNLFPKAALHRRTVWMVKRCCMVLLFPEDPAHRQMGKRLNPGI